MRLPRSASTGSCSHNGAKGPSCKVCQADLSHEKPYHQSRRLCTTHIKAMEVECPGRPGLFRFCFQCGRLEPLCDFDGQKRSCRESLRQRRIKTAPASDSQPATSGARSQHRLQSGIKSCSATETELSLAFSMTPHTPAAAAAASAAAAEQLVAGLCSPAAVAGPHDPFEAMLLDVVAEELAVSILSSSSGSGNSMGSLCRAGSSGCWFEADSAGSGGHSHAAAARAGPPTHSTSTATAPGSVTPSTARASPAALGAATPLSSLARTTSVSGPGVPEQRAAQLQALYAEVATAQAHLTQLRSLVQSLAG